MKTEHAYTDAAQRREEEVREHISWFREFLTFGTELPETIRKQYGLEEDYRRYMELAERDNRMFEEADGTEYRRHMEKIRKGEIPGPGKAYGKVVLAVEKAYERICPSPARDYLEEKYRELLFLRGMVYRKDYDDPLWYKPEILDKYGIDHRASRGTVLEQVEKAYRELDARFCRMTGKKPDADRLFGKSAAQKAVPVQREASESNAREVRMHKRGGRRPGF